MSDDTEEAAVTDQGALAARLRSVREYLNLSQQFVSEQTGIPRSAISDIERGVRRVDSLELARFSELYRYSADYLLGREPEATEEGPLKALGRTAHALTETDREEVLRFAEFLRQYGGDRQRRG
jgi:transcriptional regulator with XRE-family HTH domain